ncbi:MAG: tetratricopeptide repeat protein, partial [Acetobacteraceae bacterium]|nr:tetratricopeptide repeat protein [Acetobacteraceae bacterium]
MCPSPESGGQSGGVNISGSVGSVGGDIVGRDKIGLDEERVRRVFREELSAIAAAKDVPEAPLRAVLDKLGESRVPLEEIPARLAAAADELIRLRADLARLRDDRSEFTAIRARASALIDRGEFDSARAVLREGREMARALRKEFSRSEAEFLVDEARVNRLQLDYGAARANLVQATDLDPDNCWAWIELGDLWFLLGSLSEAEQAFREALKAAIRSGNERDLSASHSQIGDVRVAQGDLAAALGSYQAAHDIFDRLARADPGNAGWQRDLSVSRSKIGDVRVAQGDLAAALGSYQAALAMRDRLARAGPGNAGWQHDLSVSHIKIGDVQRAQGDLAALGSYQAAHDIFDRLARADPGNAGWQRDLSVSHERIGDVQSRRGETVQAIAAFEQALRVYRELQARNPTDVQSRVFSVVPLWRLGLLKGKDGRADLEVALTILKQLAAANRLDANRRNCIDQIQSNLAKLPS